MRKFVIALLLLVWPTMAFAEWHKAESDHFVVYADDSEKDVRGFAEQLERFHSAMAYLTNRANVPSSPSNRVEIYAVGNKDEVQDLAGTDSRSLAGFYIPRAGASRAFVPNIRVSSGDLDFSQIVLLHEYAHHFLWSGTSVSMPKWLSEGAAEFYASARFFKDGSVHIGRPAEHRYGELAYAREVTAAELIDPSLFEARHGNRLQSFYGRSWLLYHYLIFSPDRQGQFAAYWNGLVEGKDPPTLAREAFGDLTLLNNEMDRYLRQRKKNYYTLTRDLVPIGPVSVKAISSGHAAIMPVIIRSQRGVDNEEAVDLLPEARRIAAMYPSDPEVLAALAEAEFDAGNYERAIAAANSALAIDETIANAHIQKGKAQFELAGDSDDPRGAYRLASLTFKAISRIEPDHPIPLIYFYRLHQAQGERPSLEAMQGFARASMLAPFDNGLWFDAALMYASEGLIDRARRDLLTLASNPHGGTLSRTAANIAAALDGMPEGLPFYPTSAMYAIETADVTPEESNSER